MARLGKSWRDAAPFKDETGRIAGRKYVTEDGVEVVLNFLDPKNRERGTNVEVRIPKPQGKGHRLIKVRYREGEFIRGKRPSSR